MISEAGKNLTAKAIAKCAAAEGNNVEDIVKLIKKTYEDAAYFFLPSLQGYCFPIPFLQILITIFPLNLNLYLGR